MRQIFSEWFRDDEVLKKIEMRHEIVNRILFHLISRVSIYVRLDDIITELTSPAPSWPDRSTWQLGQELRAAHDDDFFTSCIRKTARCYPKLQEELKQIAASKATEIFRAKFSDESCDIHEMLRNSRPAMVRQLLEFTLLELRSYGGKIPADFTN